MTDDEKALWKDLSLEDANKLAHENIKVKHKIVQVNCYSFLAKLIMYIISPVFPRKYPLLVYRHQDIIAFGFNPEKTFIFCDLEYIPSCKEFYWNMNRIQKCINYNQVL